MAPDGDTAHEWSGNLNSEFPKSLSSNVGVGNFQMVGNIDSIDNHYMEVSSPKILEEVREREDFVMILTKGGIVMQTQLESNKKKSYGVKNSSSKGGRKPSWKKRARIISTRNMTNSLTSLDGKKRKEYKMSEELELPESKKTKVGSSMEMSFYKASSSTIGHELLQLVLLGGLGTH